MTTLYILALLLVAIGVASLYLVELDSGFAPWMVVLGTTAIILLAQAWLKENTLLLALFFPTAVAAVSMNVRSALVAAVIETALVTALTYLPSLGISPLIAVQGVLSIWATVGVILTAYLPIYRLLDWAWSTYQLAQQSLEQTRTQRAVSMQALSDLERANRQLALTNERMVALRALAEEAQQSKAIFVAKVSHEFRTPLNIIIGLTGLLIEADTAGAQQVQLSLQNDLKVIRRNGEHLLDLVNDVLDLSQTEAGRLSLQKEWVNLLSIIESAVEVVKPLVEKKRLSLAVSVPQNLALVYCDRIRIRQVILNLVSNATRFTDAGSIAIEVHQTEDHVEVSVRDTGPGIRPEDRERIFEPFCQGSNNLWRDKGGTGLGLSISRQLIELHHGRMSLETELGVGSTFSFILPISPVAEPFEGPVRWLQEEWPWRAPAKHPMQPNRALGPRVVVFDQTGSLERGLSFYGDSIEIIFTKAPEELSAELQGAPAHVVLANSDAPDRLWQVVEQIRPIAPDTPVIACCLSPDNRQRAREYGVLNYLTKPVTRAKLLEATQDMERPPRRILIVDDDADMRWMLARTLEADSEVEIATAATGENALEELHFQPPDLMLLDVVMPGMDGWEVLRHKASDPVLAPIPVILITGQDALQSLPITQGILMTMGGGIHLDKLLRLSLQHSALLLGLDQRSDTIKGS
ncbi:MAG: ATP-binding protein [Candidatus Marsarchaeota archaeon]|nr:ATP-binding protein [Candidatus Marsarchaeota archaeon]